MTLGQWLRRTMFAAAAVMLGVTAGQVQEQPQNAAPLVLVGAVEGAIGPATERHVGKLLGEAEVRRAEMLVLRLDTPGGLTESTREIIQAILASPVPVIGWVAPSGAHAASAGTYILYATHLAAMAPATNLGAATPVRMGDMPGGKPGGDAPEEPPVAEEEAGDADPAPPLSGADAMTRKITNDAVAFIRGLAELRDRNADWAEKAVREAASLSASAAVERGVVEFVAGDLETLLAGADGRTVALPGGDRVLDLDGAVVETIEPGAITRLLGVLSNPNIALVLMMIGVYGIIFEFVTPGTLGPGIIGAISLALGLYSLNLLPLDYAGLGLIVLGVALMVAEAFSPSFGVLGLGGLAAFVIGSAMLIDTDIPAYQVSWWLIGAIAAISGVVLILLVGIAWRAYRHAPAGVAPVIGSPAEVLDWTAGMGHVWAEGERWRATGPADLGRGERVRVAALDGLTLRVERGDRPPPEQNEEKERWSR